MCSSPAMRQPALLMILIAGSSLHSFATVITTAEGRTARAIATWTEEYQNNHAGALPKEWSDFGESRVGQMEEGMRHSAPTKRYAFISPPIILPQPQQGELVAMNRRAIEEVTYSMGILGGLGKGLRGPGRYIIYRSPEHELSCAWVTEDYVQQAFAAAAARLPVPDQEPERTWVIEARRSVYLRRFISGGVVLLIAVLAWRRRVRHKHVEC